MALGVGLLALAAIIAVAEVLDQRRRVSEADREWRELCRKLRIPADPE